MYATITEGAVSLEVPTGKISKQLPVFYNPVMQFNRDVSIALLNCLSGPFHCADIMAGSGVRTVRFIKEVKTLGSICANDMSKDAVTLITRNCELNDISVVQETFPAKNKAKDTTAYVFNTDANLFLLTSAGFNYIDIDPFGTPNPFLSAACQRIARDGIMAVTATDTSALAGTFAKPCMRKYWSTPLRNELMHEVGLRILIRKCQLIGAQFERALVPIYSVSTEHYMRVFFRCHKGKAKVDAVQKKHAWIAYCSACGNNHTSTENTAQCCNKAMQIAGPLWCGALWDAALAKKMVKKSDHSIITTIADEAHVDAVGFYDVHALSKRHKHAQIPKKETILKKVRAAGHAIAQTHINPNGFRTTMPFEEFLEVMQ